MLESTPSPRKRQGRKMLVHFPRADQSVDWSDLDAHVSPPYTVSKGNTPQKPSCDGFLIL